jgi:hypothetical protein
LRELRPANRVGIVLAVLIQSELGH